MERDKRDLSRG